MFLTKEFKENNHCDIPKTLCERNEYTNRNQPKYNHSIYDYMWLVVVCD